CKGLTGPIQLVCLKAELVQGDSAGDESALLFYSSKGCLTVAIELRSKPGEASALAPAELFGCSLENRRQRIGGRVLSQVVMGNRREQPGRRVRGIQGQRVIEERTSLSEVTRKGFPPLKEDLIRFV